MKQHLLIFLTLLLLLTGCGILERDYVQVTRHVDQTADSDSATALRAEGYAELVTSCSAWMSFTNWLTRSRFVGMGVMAGLSIFFCVVSSP